MNCFYCNCLPAKECYTETRTSLYIYNGVDRRDNSLGYILNNCVSCCSSCNFAKNNKTEEEFLIWAQNFKENFDITKFKKEPCDENF